MKEINDRQGNKSFIDKEMRILPPGQAKINYFNLVSRSADTQNVLWLKKNNNKMMHKETKANGIISTLFMGLWRFTLCVGNWYYYQLRLQVTWWMPF